MTADRSQDQARGARRPATAAQAAQDSRFRSLDQTGNVRLLTAAELDEYDAPSPAASASAPPAPATDGAAAPAMADGTTAAGPDTAAALPLPSYDTLSLASIRARLRTLDAGQLRILANYEARHAERPEVLGMLERRIEKLETGG